MQDLEINTRPWKKRAYAALVCGKPVPDDA